MSKEAVICLLDVSASMGIPGSDGKTYLEHAVNAIDLFIQQKVRDKYKLFCY